MFFGKTLELTVPAESKVNQEEELAVGEPKFPAQNAICILVQLSNHMVEGECHAVLTHTFR
jgi:hypothetical protein